MPHCAAMLLSLRLHPQVRLRRADHVEMFFAKRRYETHPELISITSGKFMSRWKMFVRIFVYLGFMFSRIKAEKKRTLNVSVMPF